MYEGLFLVGIAFILAYLFVNEKDDLFKILWFMALLFTILIAFGYCFDVASTSTSTYTALNGTVISTTVYTYEQNPEVAGLGTAFDIVIGVAMLLFIIKMLRGLLNKIPGVNT
jgi:hypothetical protein